MDVNSYVLEVIVRDRLAEMRTKGEWLARVRAAGGEPRRLRFAVGDALIRIGEWLRGPGSPSIEIEPGGSRHEPVRG